MNLFIILYPPVVTVNLQFYILKKLMLSHLMLNTNLEDGGVQLHTEVFVRKVKHTKQKGYRIKLQKMSLHILCFYCIYM